MTKKMVFRRLTVTLGIVLLGTLFSPLASAQCSYREGSKIAQPKFQPGSWQEPGMSRPASLLLVSDDGPDAKSIVGFWKVTFVAEGNDGIPDGIVIDFGYAQWHSDGTEIMNSGARPPATGNFCLGVWKKTGHSAYKLNHFAISSDLNGNLVGPANIREAVVLDRSGDSYSGSFTINQFDQSGNTLAHITGQVTATRITVDTAP